jgi:hypothetical protein
LPALLPTPQVRSAARPTTLVQVKCAPSVPAIDAVKPTMQEQHDFRGPSNKHSYNFCT